MCNAFSLKDSQNLQMKMQSLPLYTPCLFYMILNYYFVDNEKSDGICSTNFVVDEFSRLFLNPSIFFIKHLIFRQTKNYALSNFDIVQTVMF